MKKVSRTAALLLFALAVSSHSPCAQQKPLTRTFIVGSEERYQVTVIIRVETHGVSAEKIGEKTYATPFTHEANGQLSWRSNRKITGINPDGIAGILETLDRFEVNCNKDPNSKGFDASLQKSVQETCTSWQNLSQMNYQEEKFGFILGLPVVTSQVSDLDSSLLTLWIRHGLRPSVILPKTPLHFGDRAAHKISNPSGASSNPEGEESMEWLEASSDPPAATLHVSQSLSWVNAPLKKNTSSTTDKPNQRHLFYADSLNTISLLDGSLLKASRSATREAKDVLEPVPGLP